MSFAPQRRALFRHPNLQKWREHVVFCTFWLPNALRATTACTFSTSEPPKVVRTPCVFNILTSKCASRHNCVHFFEIWTSKSGPTMVCFGDFDLEMCFAPQRRAIFQFRARRFSEPTFRPSGAPNHWKNTVFRDFPTFSRISIFFLLTLSLLLFFLLIFLFSLPLPCSAFHLSILSEVWLLNFLRWLQYIYIHNYILYWTVEHACLVSDKDQCHSFSMFVWPLLMVEVGFSAKETTQRQLQLTLSVWRRKGVAEWFFWDRHGFFGDTSEFQTWNSWIRIHY